MRVNALCPGPVTGTRLSKDLGRAIAERLGVSPEKQLADFLEGIPQGRAQTADEIAAAALFLVSPSGRRDYWAGSERGRRNDLLLRSSSSTSPRRANPATTRVRGSAQARLSWRA